MNDWHNRKDGESGRGSDDERIERLLDELREADPPPASLVHQVMTGVRGTMTAVRQRRTGDPRMAKKALIGLAAAAALVLAVFTTLGWPPALPGTEGTIGAAKRHQAQQMTAQDVKLGDTTTQEFLQSDVVARTPASDSASRTEASARAARRRPSASAARTFASASAARAPASFISRATTSH